MSRKVLASGAQPCVWMCAGVLRYRLCTHEYDCDNCPLDAALRGDARIPAAHPLTSPYAPAFPDDRRYAVGHTWLREAPGGKFFKERSGEIRATGKYDLEIEITLVEEETSCDGDFGMIAMRPSDISA